MATGRPDDDRPTRRRRRRTPTTARPAETTEGAPRASTPQRRRSTDEPGLRGIAGAGGSQLGVDAALRARDVNRPSADDLAEAERDVTIVRRNWTPPR